MKWPAQKGHFIGRRTDHLTDLHLDLDPGVGRRRALEDALRGAIRSGMLLPGTRLPSSRTLAVDLGLARATVVSAYDQLVAEGYLAARHGSGTRVASLPSQTTAGAAVASAGPRYAADFRPGEPDLTLFPRAGWATALGHVLRSADTETFGYGDPRGSLVLRQALAAYLGRARAVVADADRLFVFSGFSDAVSALTAMLGDIDGRPVAVEEPCLPMHRAAVARGGTPVRSVAVDSITGFDVDALIATDAGTVLTTPAHQYPLGSTLSPRRRLALVDWARARDAWIIEDDYDGEFRYDRQPVGALQGLAPDRVIYAGSASKSLAPGVALGWLVVPSPLVNPLVDRLRLRVTTSVIEQAAFAHFLQTGGFDRHLRRTRAIYRRRRHELLAMLEADAPQLAVVGVPAGLHVTAEVDTQDQERAMRGAAEAASVAVLPLSFHYVTTPSRSGLVIGYTRPAEHAFPAALRRLRKVLRATSDGRT